MRKGGKDVNGRLRKNMRKKKIAGWILLAATVIYFLAFALSLYQNQRVKMETEMKESFKAYSQMDGSQVKELDKDLDLLLQEKVNVKDAEQQIMKYEGSFARMETNLNGVTNEIASVEYTINQINEKADQLEKQYHSLYEEIQNQNTLYESERIELEGTITELKSDMERMETELKNMILDNASEAEANIQKLLEQIQEHTDRLQDLEGNVLYYQYDSDSQTLNIYGDQGGEASE